MNQARKWSITVALVVLFLTSITLIYSILQDENKTKLASYNILEIENTKNAGCRWEHIKIQVEKNIDKTVLKNTLQSILNDNKYKRIAITVSAYLESSEPIAKKYITDSEKTYELIDSVSDGLCL